jgi:putative endonuclease
MQLQNTTKLDKTSGQKELSKTGEDVTFRYLQQNGIQILERNWKCKAGEANLIIKEDEDIVFVEVKTRKGITGGFPEETINAAKRARYEKIALHYLASRDLPSARIRFDVISVSMMDKQRAMLRHHRDAFATA